MRNFPMVCFPSYEKLLGPRSTASFGATDRLQQMSSMYSTPRGLAQWQYDGRRFFDAQGKGLGLNPAEVNSRMATIVGGFSSSHGPLMSLPSELWQDYAQRADPKNRELV